MRHFIFWALVHLFSLSSLVSLDSNIVMGPSTSFQCLQKPSNMPLFFHPSWHASRHIPSAWINCFSLFAPEIIEIEALCSGKGLWDQVIRSFDFIDWGSRTTWGSEWQMDSLSMTSEKVHWQVHKASATLHWEGTSIATSSQGGLGLAPELSIIHGRLVGSFHKACLFFIYSHPEGGPWVTAGRTRKPTQGPGFSPLLCPSFSLLLRWQCSSFLFLFHPIVSDV